MIYPRSLVDKIVTRSLVGQSDSLSTIDTIHPIDMNFGTYNMLHLYFPLSETTWCLMSGFHNNNSQINDVTGGRHLGFLKFSDFVQIFTFVPKLTGKQHSTVEIHEIARIHYEVLSN